MKPAIKYSLFCFALLFTLACGETSTPNPTMSDLDVDADTDTDTDSDSDADTDTDGDTGTTPVDSDTLDTDTVDTGIGGSPLVDPGTTPLQIRTNEDFRLEMGTGSVPLGNITYNLTNAPRGMRIQPKTGIVTWYPTVDQQGSLNVTVNANVVGDRNYSEVIPINVVYGNPDAPGIYVAQDGNDAGTGTASDPFATINKAVDQTNPGDTVYVRGGNYYNSTYGDNDPHNWNPAVRVNRSGTSANWITYRPLGNEQAKLRFDASDGFKINASYIVIDGFEIEGPAASITYDEAVAFWWTDGDAHLVNGSAITAHDEYVIIRNNVVHHCSSRAIGGYGSDHLTIENNIAYNNSWWTLQGTHGISLVTMTSTDGNANATKNIIRGNLAFGNEQRIMSRIYNKGYADLNIDEGCGIHLQDSLHNHVGRPLIENNLSVYNGKAGLCINTVDNVTVANNSTYFNGLTTGPGTADGIIIQAAAGTTFINDLMHAQETHRAMWTMGGTSGTTATNTFVVPGIDDTSSFPTGFTVVSDVFADPAGGDFEPHPGVSIDAGVKPAVLDAMLAKCADYGIVIQPTGYVIDEAQLTQDIVNAIPAEASVDMTNYPDTITVNFPVGSTHPAAPSFELRIHSPY